jgi:hypothetical protein
MHILLKTLLKEVEESKEPEKPKAPKIPENFDLNNLENFWKETNNKPKPKKKAKIVYVT